MKIKSGGGITSNKLNVRPMPRTSSPAQAMSPTAISRLGAHVGNHTTGKGKVAVPEVPLIRAGIADASGVPLGNAKAMDVGKGGPGAGRTTMPCGSQGRHK